MDEIIIISLGGSLIIPQEIDVDFLKSFKEMILRYVEQGKRFVIITGGGKVCRKYQDAGRKVRDLTSDDLDWLGIHTTRLNAEFVKILFGDVAEEAVIIDPTLPVNFNKSVVFGGGWKPGWSTDYVAVVLGSQLGAKKIINLSNIDYAYDKDPNKFSDAQKIEKISWLEYEKLIPREWNPGLSTPFDPIASRLAQADNMEVVILNGKNIRNLEKCIDGGDFIGTHIK
ncbi:MAG: UMP kinase [Candidatus Pacebacteria bacterium]|jgi:uridylate kinase|nr:UMP kinase [Candidatus Paceibacterota bacterium]